MYHQIFSRRRSGRVWRHALSLGLALTLVSVGLRYKALAAAGDLDPAFGNGGKVTTTLGSGSEAYAIARQLDGKLVVAGGVDGGDFGLARYRNDGTLDSTFGMNGQVKTDFSNAANQNLYDQGYAVSIQPDGKIVAAGSAGNDFGLARYDANGTLDPSFGSSGKVTTNFESFGFGPSYALAIAIQPDGKIIAAGGAEFFGPEFALARFNSDGSLDTSFGQGGKILTLLSLPIPCECGGVKALALQSDGKIIATGGAYFGLARYNSNGSLDATFGNGGTVGTVFPGTSEFAADASAVVLQPDDKFVIAGSSSGFLQDFRLARYNSNGSLDAGFGNGGTVTTDFGGLDAAFALALQPDGKLVATGVTGTDHDEFALARYNNEGSLDPTFGSGGKLTTDFGALSHNPGNSTRANAVVLQPDGKIVVAGTAIGQTWEFALVRYLTDASLPTANAIDDTQTFVRQHYRDFLNREPDQSGWGYWTSRITQCGGDTICIHERRIGVSAAFFIEQEFQDTGYYVCRFYKASFGRQPNYTEFTSDRGKVIVGSSLELNKQAFADEWVQRAAFTQAYPNMLSNTEVINKLFDSAGLIASIYDAQRQQEIAAMNAGRNRALVLRDVIEIPDFKNFPDPTGPRYNELKQTSQYNAAFVLMQYFGYLRRDVDQAGYDFWLDVVNNREPNNYQGMVCAFITSAEYQLRFGPELTRTNHDCSQ